MNRLWPLFSLLLGLGVWLACSDPVATPDSVNAEIIDPLFSPSAELGPGRCPVGFRLITIGAGADVDRNGDCAACEKALENGSTVTIDNNVGGPGEAGAFCPTKKP